MCGEMYTIGGMVERTDKIKKNVKKIAKNH